MNYHVNMMAQLMIWMALFKFGRKSHRAPRAPVAMRGPFVMADKVKGYDQLRRDARNAERVAEKAALAEAQQQWIRTTTQKIAARERARKAHERLAQRGAD